MSNRDNYIDFLRFIGIALIILAHIYAPITITQIRCFDVPMMVFISGLSYSGKKVRANWSSFYKPRLLRLLIPVYIFTTFYIILLSICGININPSKIVNSYLLLENNSIGYVWIIRVFILVMLIIPLLIKLNEGLSLLKFWLSITILYLLQSIIVNSILPLLQPSPLLHSIFIETIPYMVGYSIFFLIGLRIRYELRNKIFFSLVSCIIICLGSFYLLYTQNGLPLLITQYKYPPQSYYIIYGITVSICLWYMRPILSKLSNKLFIFIGQNTIWIYLWHIIYVLIANKFFHNWIIRYIFVFSFACVTFYIQYQVVKYLHAKFKIGILKYFIG